jgi:hypothetical protein
MASVSRPEWCSTSACGSGTIAFESCVCWVMFLVFYFNALFLCSRVVAGHVVVRAGQPPCPVSATLNGVPRALAVQVQLRLKVVFVGLCSRL